MGTNKNAISKMIALFKRALAGLAATRCCRAVSQLYRDEDGYFLIIMSLLLPVIVGIVGFGTEGSLILYKVQRLQSAADSAAVSAATAYSLNPFGDTATQAKAISATYGFVDGTKNVTVTVNIPPQAPPSCASMATTAYTNNAAAVEVIVRQPQAPLFSAIWVSQPFNICGRSVALLTGGDCMLALGKTSTGANASKAIQVGPGEGGVSFPNCGVFSNSTASDSIALQGAATLSAASIGTAGDVSDPHNNVTPSATTHANPIPDPYANVPVPSTSGLPCLTVPNNAKTLSPGRYCGSTTLGNITLSPGLYFFDSNLSTGTTLSISHGTVTGNDVTLVFTCSACTSASQYPSTMMSIGANGNINVSAPNSSGGGAISGIVLFGDRTMPLDTVFNMGANGSATFNGAIYLPNGQLQTQTANNGAGVPCTQFIANTIVIKNGGLQAQGCIGNGTTPIGGSARLVE